MAQHGLALPAGWGFRCPGPAIVDGTPRWGVACWNCDGDGQSWIAVDIGRIGASDKALRYVIAHETCHAIDYMTLGIIDRAQRRPVRRRPRRTATLRSFASALRRDEGLLGVGVRSIGAALRLEKAMAPISTTRATPAMREAGRRRCPGG